MNHISFFFTLLMSLSIFFGFAFGQQYVPDTNTVALWYCDEVYRDSVYDASGNGNLGFSIGTTIVDGRFGKARSFNGVSDRVTVPSTPMLNVSPLLTLEAWIKPTGFSVGPNTFLRKNGPNSQNGYLMHFGDNGTRFEFGINTKWGLGTSTPVNPSYFLDGRWHHVAGTYDGSIARVYFDGVLVDQDAFNETIGTNSTDPVSIGANDIYGEYFQGLIDEVRISNTVRQPNEFNLQLPPKNLIITAQGKTLNLSWENGGGAVGLLQYKIYRGTDSISITLIDSTISISYTDSNVTSGTIYFYRVAALDSTYFEGAKSFAASGMTIFVGIVEEQNLPREYTLEQNFPNPFNPSTTIKYSVPHTAHVTLTIFNTLGQRIATVIDENKEAGYYQANLDATNLLSGIYFYRLQAGKYLGTKKLLLLK
ncbi:MAG: LamG-like jellyroll fold domain-containing protein [Bacteroidota bacterium]|nr:LamG-like jellyroll fold domain-containing protein [Bacteroidota bacterium]